MSRFYWILRVILEGRAPLPRANDPAPSRDAALERALEQAKAGYGHAQDVIKFIDSKTAFVTGLSTLAAGFLIATLKWAVEGSTEPVRASLMTLCGTHPRLGAWLIVVVGLSLGAALVCLAAAVWTVIARERPANLESPFTILFPIYSVRQQRQACRYFEEKLKGLELTDILKEYEDQLRVVGMILGRKMKHIRVSCIALLLQMAFVVAAVILITILYTSAAAEPADRDVPGSAHSGTAGAASAR